MTELQTTEVEEIKASFDGAVRKYQDRLTEIEGRQGEIGGEFNQELQGLINNSTDEIEAACRNFETNCNGSPAELKGIKTEFRKAIIPWYSKSYLMTRATTKPRGFPGDFMLLERIYDNVPVPDSSQGVGMYLDRWFLDSHLALAVRNRKDYMRNLLASRLNERKDSAFNILNLASGPCREWQELPSSLNLKNVKLTCVDIDQEALDYLRTRLNGLEDRGLELVTANENIIKMALRKKEEIEKKYGLQDLVYSIGLFDYLPDSMLAKVVSRGYDLLKEKGSMLLAFKDREKYQTTRYDWLTDWNFQPRNEQTATEFLEKNGFKLNQMKVSREPLNTIIFYEITKR